MPGLYRSCLKSMPYLTERVKGTVEAVFWAQGLACFLLWIGYGVVQSRRSEAIRVKVGGMSRTARAVLGALLMVGGAALLIGAGLLMDGIGGFAKTGMTPIGWLIVATAGLVFVHAQTMSFAMLVSLAHETVTNQDRPPSDHRNEQG